MPTNAAVKFGSPGALASSERMLASKPQKPAYRFFDRHGTGSSGVPSFGVKTGASMFPDNITRWFRA
jgi:hypothetical protein